MSFKYFVYVLVILTLVLNHPCHIATLAKTRLVVAQEHVTHANLSLPSSAVTRAHCGFGGFDRTARSGTPGSFPPPGIIRTLVQGKRFKLRLAVAGVPMGVPFREFINAEPTGKRLATGRLMTGRLWTTH